MDWGASVFGEYTRCINNRTTDSPSSGGKDSNGDEIYGSVTCGWTGVSEHDKCESSISISKTYTASQIPFYPLSQLNASNPTTRHVTTTSYSTCPPQTTAIATNSALSPSPTNDGSSSASALRPDNVKSWVLTMFAVLFVAQMYVN